MTAPIPTPSKARFWDKVCSAVSRHWSILFFAITIIVFVAFVGTIFYVRGRVLMQNEIKDKLRSVAAVAAGQFDGDTIEKINDINDEASPAYKQTVHRLQDIRLSVPSVRFAYIMRRTKDLNVLAFVADADSALTDAELDRNSNGFVDDDEKPAAIGELYRIDTLPVLQNEAFLHPAVDATINSDQWGSVLSGYAPIHRASDGKIVAIVGVDMDAAQYTAMQDSIFSPLAFILLFIAGSLIVVFTFMHLTRNQVQELKKLDSERSGLLRLAFHQLGGPLTILNWSIETMKERKADEPIDKQIANMEEGMMRLDNILNSLREANQVHEGTIEYKPEYGSLTDIITRVTKEYEVRLQRSRQNVVLSLHSDLKMNLDKKLITAVMRELIGNAMDFSPPGNTITIRTSQVMDSVQVEVHDQGYGIPAKDQDRIFQQFMRASNATKYKPDGSGLGLYIVRGLVERAGGKIWIESKEGHGTSVFFRLRKS